MSLFILNDVNDSLSFVIDRMSQPSATHRESLPSKEDARRRIELWMDLMRTCEQFLLAGLRNKTGPDRPLRDVYRQWYENQVQQQDQTLRHTYEEFQRRGRTSTS